MYTRGLLWVVKCFRKRSCVGKLLLQSANGQAELKEKKINVDTNFLKAQINIYDKCFHSLLLVFYFHIFQ